MKKFLVLTSITGDKDKLTDPENVYSNCDYIAYVDHEFDTKIWKQKAINHFSTIDKYANRRNAKLNKVLSCTLHNDYEYVIWQDGNQHLKINPECFLKLDSDADIFLFRHPDRDCSFNELQAVANWGLDEFDNLSEQYEFLKSSGLPTHYGLYELPVLIRRNSFLVRELELKWWELICKYSSRDQTSLPYVLWTMKDKVNVHVLDGCASKFTMSGIADDNKYFKYLGRHNWH